MENIDFGKSCSNPDCTLKGLRENDLGLEFYIASKKNCDVVLCMFCKTRLTKCPRPGCIEALKAHELKTPLTIAYKKTLDEMENQVKLQLKCREKIIYRYHKELQEIHSDEFNELIEDVIYAKMNESTQMYYERKEKVRIFIDEFRKTKLMEIEDDQVLLRPPPKLLKVIKNQGPFKGFLETEFHLCRLSLYKQ